MSVIFYFYFCQAGKNHQQEWSELNPIDGIQQADLEHIHKTYTPKNTPPCARSASYMKAVVSQNGHPKNMFQPDDDRYIFAEENEKTDEEEEEVNTFKTLTRFPPITTNLEVNGDTLTPESDKSSPGYGTLRPYEEELYKYDKVENYMTIENGHLSQNC